MTRSGQPVQQSLPFPDSACLPVTINGHEVWVSAAVTGIGVPRALGRRTVTITVRGGQL